MIRLSKAVILILLLSVFACSGNKKSGPITFLVPRAVVIPGGQGEQKVNIEVAAPYHFNKDFPSRLKILAPGGLRFKEKQWGKTIFRKTDTGAVAVIHFKAPKDMSGKKTIFASIDCSICRADECRVFKGMKVDIPVEIKKNINKAK